MKLSSTKMTSERSEPRIFRSISNLIASSSMLLLCLLIGCLLISYPVQVEGRSVLGVDLGATYMKVALVRSGSPLSIVTNFHSKRKTEQMVLFDQNKRFFGADANGLLPRKAHLTPTAMSEFLGRAEFNRNVKAMEDRYFPILPVYNETRKGLTLNVPKVGDFTPEELVAMVLQHAVDFSTAYAEEAGSPIPPPQDIMLTVPSFATQLERMALLDAAHLANLNVLGLIDETTAAALHYATDKNFDTEQTILFYNMGSSSLQVSIVRFYQYEQKSGFGKPKPTPAIQVLSKAVDPTLGGLEWDRTLVDYFADEFNALWHKKTGILKDDIRNILRPMTKIRLAANKAKNVLSANTEYPVQLDGLHDDVSLTLTVTRDDLEKMTQSLLDRVVKPVQDALAAANMSVTDLTGVELLGGGMRVPSVQAKLKSVLDSVELGLHMNADESMALGAAFAGANISTAFRVRQVGMTDITLWPQQITLHNLGDPIVEVSGSESDIAAGWQRKFQPYSSKKGEEEWSKKATLFKAYSKVGVKKTIAFTHDEDVHCSLDYEEQSGLEEPEQRALERYEISGVKEFSAEMQEKGFEGKPKVSLQFELSSSGITSLIKAEASMEETYTVEEEVEVDDDDGDNSTDAGNETEAESTNDAEDTKKADKAASDEADKKTDEEEAATERKLNEESDANKTDDSSNSTEKAPKEKKKKKFVKIQKEKKKVHKRTLNVNVYYEGKVQPNWDSLFQSSKAKLDAMTKADQERIMLEAAKNKVESYMFMVKNRLIDDEEELATVSTEEQREACRKLSADTELWLEEDGYAADLATLEDKYAELSGPFEKIILRLEEKKSRPEMINKITKRLEQAEGLLEIWKTSMPHITDEEREKVEVRITSVRGNVTELEEAQAAKEPHEEPAYLTSELVEIMKPLESILQRLSKKPKPKPEKKKDDKADDANTTSSANNETGNATDGNTTDETRSSAEGNADASKEDGDSSENETDDEL